MQQALGAAGAGIGGGSAREAGMSPTTQAVASLIGGVATPMAANGLLGAAKTGITALKTAMTPQKVIDQQIDQQITMTLRGAGIDWAGVSERVKQGLRSDVQSAVTNGQPLDPASVARMLQFRLVPNAQPTRGMLSQDPVQITSEQNLAKVGANSTDLGLQRLPNLQSNNTAALISTLDDAGARNAPDSFAAGQRVIDSLSSVVRGNQRNISELYNGARDTAGRSAPLDGHSFTMNANRALDEANVGSFLTPDIANKMNAIAKGEIPLTVDVAEQLKTSIGNIQRGSADGNVRKALGIVRGALDDAPLQSAPKVNPGNLPAVSGTVPKSPVVLGEQSIEAFNAARSANRAWMQRIESTPALKAVVDGVEPDKFVSKFITGQGATVADVHSLRDAVSHNPQALGAIKQTIVAHLKDEAVPKEGINIFNASGYNRALERIGDRKLAAFFSAEEISTLKAVGNVSNLMSAQPAGTAVNNSNSGAMVVAKAMGLLDAVSSKVPLGVGPVIQGTIRGLQQRQVMNAPQALMQKKPPVGLLQRLGAPAIYGGLLASQPSQ